MNRDDLFSFARPVAALALAGLAAGCATPPAPPQVPAAIRAPAGQVLFLEALASGVQIYECTAKPGTAQGHEWTFRSPEAALADRGGRPLGKHYAGPSWEAADGSVVVGEVKARDPGPDKAAIPWLLLNAKSTTGNGVFSATRSIQRIHTTAGLAPDAACTAGQVGQTARVPYTAVYYFYR